MKSSLEITSNAKPSSVAPSKSDGSIQALDPLTIPDWNSLVAALPGNTFFHTVDWARVLEQSYGYKPLYFAKTQGSELRSLLPVMEVNSWLTGKRGVSLPFSDACREITTESNVNGELFMAACAEGRKRGWKYIETRGTPGIPDATPCESFYDHVLKLSTDEEKVFGTFESSVRRAIRKGEKSEVKLEMSKSLEGMQTFYNLHCQTRQKHGVPPQPFSFFANFHRNVIARNLGFVVIARFQGQPIAADVFVHSDTKAIYKYGASDESFQHLRGSNLVMWHAIVWYARAGFTEIGFGRTEKVNAGLRRFKLGWGTEERLIEYFKYDLRSNRFRDEKPEKSGKTTEIFKRIPVPIARMVGSVLYRHVG